MSETAIDPLLLQQIRPEMLNAVEREIEKRRVDRARMDETAKFLSPAQRQAGELLDQGRRHTKLVGGSRSGKTTTLVRKIVQRALKGDGSRHVIFRFRENAAWKSIGLDTLPTVMRRFFPGVRLTEHKADGYFSLPNGSEIWIAGLDNNERVDRILGLEFVTIFFNECSQIPFSSVVTALTRLAQVVAGLVQQAYYDLNPVGQTHWTNRQFGEHKDPLSRQPLPNPEDYVRQFMNPEDNAANLDPAYLTSLRNLPLRARNRFYRGIYVQEHEGALWTYEAIERARRPAPDQDNLRRVVVAVDASGASSRQDLAADEIGIVVAALGADGHAYVLADRSCRDSPTVWGRVVAQACEDFGADCVVAEKNFGGEMVRFVIKTANPLLLVRMVTASRGKVVRAEPVSALYGDDESPSRVHHTEIFTQMEDQMAGFTTTGYVGDESPDRADALVWALTELLLTGQTVIMAAPVVVTTPLVIHGSFQE